MERRLMASEGDVAICDCCNGDLVYLDHDGIGWWRHVLGKSIHCGKVRRNGLASPKPDSTRTSTSAEGKR